MRSAAILILSLGSLSGAAAAADGPFDDLAGRQLYQRFCASCHGPGGAGDGPVAASFRTMIPDLAELSRRSNGSFPEERVRRIIDGRTALPVHGTREMPVWGREFAGVQGGEVQGEAASARMLAELVTYLRSIQR